MTRRKTDTDPLLPGLLAEMFAVSAERGAGVHRRLNSGLHLKVAVRGQKRQVILWRDGGRLPGRKECEIVARDAGFTHPAYRMWRCQESDEAFLLTERPPAAHPAAPELRGEVCGLCRHGERAGCGMVACELGWEAHDGLWSQEVSKKGKRWVPALMGHPGVPVPLLAPQTRCMAVGGRWLPKGAAA